MSPGRAKRREGDAGAPMSHAEAKCPNHSTDVLPHATT